MAAPSVPRQIALPLAAGARRADRIAIGNANERVLRAFADAASWPFRTAILSGPPRSGKSLLARAFEAGGHGDAIDDADRVGEDALFHRWNRAQHDGRPLLLVAPPVGPGGWRVALPDLASRLGAALALAIEPPDDAMLAALIEAHARQRSLALGEDAATYLVPRCERSFAGVERLIATIDRLGLERKQPPTLAIWRDALAENGSPPPGDLP